MAKVLGRYGWIMWPAVVQKQDSLTVMLIDLDLMTARTQKMLELDADLQHQVGANADAIPC